MGKQPSSFAFPHIYIREWPTVVIEDQRAGITKWVGSSELEVRTCEISSNDVGVSKLSEGRRRPRSDLGFGNVAAGEG